MCLFEAPKFKYQYTWIRLYFVSKLRVPIAVQEGIHNITFPTYASTCREYDMIFSEAISIISFRMGSFTSMSKIIPATDADKDIKQEFRYLGNGQKGTESDEQKYVCPLNAFLDYCSKGLIGQPEPISRTWRKVLPCDHKKSMETPAYFRQENIRVLQWNVLSQSKSLPLLIVDRWLVYFI